MYFFQNSEHSSAFQYSNGTKNIKVSLLCLPTSPLSLFEWVVIKRMFMLSNVAALDIYKKKSQEVTKTVMAVRDAQYASNISVWFHFTVRDDCKNLFPDGLLFFFFCENTRNDLVAQNARFVLTYVTESEYCSYWWMTTYSSLAIAVKIFIHARFAFGYKNRWAWHSDFKNCKIKMFMGVFLHL